MHAYGFAFGAKMKEPGSGVGQSVMRELPKGTRTSVLKQN